MEKFKNVVLLNGYGTMNRGDHALLKLSNYYIKKSLGENVNISSIVLYPNKEKAEDFDCNTILPHLIGGFSESGRSRKLLLARNILWFGLTYITGKSIKFKGKEQTIKKIKEADVTFSCAGGYINDASTGFISTCAEILMAKRFKKPVILLPQSIGPFRKDWKVFLVGKLLKKVELIFVRDQSSMDLCLNELKISPKNITKIPDLMFGDIEKLPQKPIVKSKVGLTVINWLWPGENRTDMQKKYIKEVADFIKTIHKDYDVNLFEQAKGINGISGDTVAINQLVEGLDRMNIKVNKVPTGISLEEYISEVRSCEYFIASRLHSGLFAIVGETPTMTIAYQPKTKGAMQLVGMDDFTINIEDVESNKLKDLFIGLRHFENRRSKVKDGLKTVQNELKMLPIIINERLAVKKND